MHSVGENRRRDLPVIPATLRTLAADLRSGADVNALIAAFGRALSSVPPLRGFTVSPLDESHTFEPDHLTVPLIGSGGPLGALQIAAGGDRSFRASRLHLAGALADLAAVVIEHAMVARTRSAPPEIIAVALADVPVGVLCFDGSGALIYANPAANLALGGRVPPDWMALWTAHAPAGRKEPGSSFVLRHAGRLVHVTARRLSPTGPGAVVLTDLASRVKSFGEVLASEVYRSLVERQPLVLGVIAGMEGSPAALEAIELAGGVMPAGARVGPVEAEAVGIVVARSLASSLWPVLQQVARAAREGEPLQGGVASLHAGGDTPGALVARAVADMRSLSTDARPGLLVCDRSPAVNDMLALILRRDFSVTCAGRWSEGIALLREQSYDGVVLELPVRGDAAALEFAREALTLQPAAQPFFVTELPGPWDLGELGQPGAPVFRKPFVVRDVRTTLKSVFASRTG